MSEKRFNQIENQISALQQDMTAMKQNVDALREDMASVRQRVDSSEGTILVAMRGKGLIHCETILTISIMRWLIMLERPDY